MERVFKSFSLKYVPCTFCLCMRIPLGVIHAPGSEFGHIVLLGDGCSWISHMFDSDQVSR